MSGIPDQIPQFGDASLKPRQNPEFVPGAGFGTEDYFVWSRCDGMASLHDIILMTGFATDKSIQILGKLRSMGAVLLPGENRPPAAAAPQAARATAEGAAPPEQRERRPRPQRQSKAAPVAKKRADTADDLSVESLGELSPDEQAALAEDNALSEKARLKALQYARLIQSATHFELLGIDADADKKAVKRAYFRLSREFHPDRYYGKELGSFGPWLEAIFKAVNDAFKVLGDNKKRAKYEAELRGDDGSSEAPQTKEEHALGLFQTACEHELLGESEEASKYFAAAIRMDEQPRYLRRAAMFAVSAQDIESAERYARRALELRPKDASYARTLADVYRAAKKLDEAQEVIEKALALDIENDILFGELQADLASVKEDIADRDREESVR